MVGAGEVARRQDRALDDVDVRSRALHQLGALLGASRDRRDRATGTRLFDDADPAADQLRLDRLSVGLLEDGVHVGAVGLGDAPDHRRGVLVARVHPVQVEDGDAAQP